MNIPITCLGCKYTYKQKYQQKQNFVFKPQLLIALAQATPAATAVNKILKSKFIFTRNLNRGLPKLTITPAVSYINAKINKSLIFKDIKDKAFVYRWINLLNNKEYLGSTSNAKKRLNTYFDLKTLAKVKMPIYNAILKYGHENFTFEIIEYCPATAATAADDIIKREQYYLDNFDFEYNVLANANSLAGYKHTAETLEKMKGKQNLLGFKHSQETINKLREFNLGKVHYDKAKAKMKNAWTKRKVKSAANFQLLPQQDQEKAAAAARQQICIGNWPLLWQKAGQAAVNKTIQSKTKKEGKIVVVTNIETNISKEYKSISEAAFVLNLTRVTLRKYINNKEIFNMLLPQQEGPSGLVKEKYFIYLKDKT